MCTWINMRKVNYRSLGLYLDKHKEGELWKPRHHGRSCITSRDKKSIHMLTPRSLRQMKTAAKHTLPLLLSSDDQGVSYISRCIPLLPTWGAAGCTVKLAYLSQVWFPVRQNLETFLNSFLLCFFIFSPCAAYTSAVWISSLHSIFLKVFFS